MNALQYNVPSISLFQQFSLPSALASITNIPMDLSVTYIV